MNLTELLESLQEAQTTMPGGMSPEVRLVTEHNREFEIYAIFSEGEGKTLWVQIQDLQPPVPEIRPKEPEQ
jgi:hypothetical protein